LKTALDTQEYCSMGRCRLIALATIGICSTTLDASDVTFTKDIAPILWKHCAPCHRPGEIGPFSLITYKDTAKRAAHLKEVTASRRMPPWKPKPGFGEFVDERRLTADDIATIAQWADSGAKEGAARDLPPPPRFVDGWKLGKPDLIIKMPEHFEVPPAEKDVFRCFVIPTGIEEDKIVSAIEFRPGNRSVVHHAVFYLDNTAKAREFDEADAGPGYAVFAGAGPGVPPTGSLGAWAPGSTPHLLPADSGRIMRKNSDVIMAIHYHPNGKPESDRSSLGVFFSKNTSASRVLPLVLVGGPINIPAGENHYRVGKTLTLPAGATALGIGPHMHYVGREMKMTATMPDGKVVPLVWITDWDFNWQGLYWYRQPIRLPKGTKIEMEAFFDNSAGNPQNPNSPPERVRGGNKTTDEMSNCQVLLVADDPAGHDAIRREMVPAGKKKKKFGGNLPMLPNRLE
jgi:hypothetical protein